MKNFYTHKYSNNKKACLPCLRTQGRQGFALFYTIIMISVISAIAFGLASITYKQKNLASLAYDSQTAFYAADAGMECALYNNQRLLDYTNPANATIDCFDTAPNNFGQFLTLNIDLLKPIWTASSRKETCFSFEFDPGTLPMRPSFSAKGYSTCQPNSSRYVERNLRAFF